MPILPPLLLIPAAGFGRRVGSPPAKELLPDKMGRPLILHSLELAAERRWPSLVITRGEKVELLEFLAELPIQLRPQILTIGESTDWPHTLLASQSRWLERNLVVLPDTRFEPVDCLDRLAVSLVDADIAWAEHRVADRRLWGCFEAVAPDRVRICEKPSTDQPGTAWGLFGFRKMAGLRLLQAQALSTVDHQWYELQANYARLEITSFVDLCRPGPGDVSP